MQPCEALGKGVSSPAALGRRFLWHPHNVDMAWDCEGAQSSLRSPAREHTERPIRVRHKDHPTISS